MHSTEGALIPDESVNNSGDIQIPVVVWLPYLQYIFKQPVQVVPKHSDGGCTTFKF